MSRGESTYPLKALSAAVPLQPSASLVPESVQPVAFVLHALAAGRGLVCTMRRRIFVIVRPHFRGKCGVCVGGSGMVCGGVVLSAVGCCLWLTIAGGVSSPPSYSYTRKGHHYTSVVAVVCLAYLDL